MYKKYKRKTVLLYIFGTLAIGICLALIIFFIWIMALRTEYKKTCLEINDRILSASEGMSFVMRNGEKYPLSSEAMNYFDQVLLDKKTGVYNRKPYEITDKSIVMEFSDCTLSFSGLEDGTAISIRWETPEKTRNYTIRSVNYTFINLNSYLTSYIRRIKP